ncbi:hypothetical protein E2C01_089479 [Portunus trituberculatus]|uniref:Uncharacterized protein n=1 Tax=Portunus trituberculatus TaxID=210409 RepID=A0A5B7JIB4_PORTR|nr:hypothetical protein [Portunus trituberculatus]
MYDNVSEAKHSLSRRPSLTGLLSTPISIEGHAWPRAAVGDPQWPEVQMGFTPFTLGNDYGILSSRVLGIDRNVSIP